VGFDGGLHPVHPLACLNPFDRRQKRRLVHDASHLLVLVEGMTELARQRFQRRLADPGDLRSHLTQGVDELRLVIGKGGLDEDHVHRRLLRVFSWPRAS